MATHLFLFEFFRRGVKGELVPMTRESAPGALTQTAITDEPTVT